MEDASGAAKVRRNGWPRKISPSWLQLFFQRLLSFRSFSPFSKPYTSFLCGEEQAGLFSRGLEGLCHLWGPSVSSCSLLC